MKLTDTTEKTRGLLRTHLWLVLLATVMALGAAVAAAAAKPMTYTATADVVVSPEQTETTALLPDMGTERAIALSGSVVQPGATALGTDDATVRKALSVSIGLETRVLHISYTTSTPEGAFRGAEALATSYVGFRNSQVHDPVAAQVTRPSVPTSGSRGSLPLYLVLGLVAGLTVGVAAAWLWDRVSDRVRSAAELRQLTGLPILRRTRRWDSRQSPLPAGGPARESFAFLAARLTSLTGRGGGKAIVVTSPRPGAGTTSVACGTAVALAGQGKRVVLVAASHAGLRAEQVLGGAASSGSTDPLSQARPPEEALHPTDVPDLSVITTGGAAGLGAELEDVRQLLNQFKRWAYVVIDAPPVLTSADSLLLADAADLVVLVGDLRSGTRTDVREAMALLDDVEPKLAGWVANVPRARRAWGRASTPVSARSDTAEEKPADVEEVTSPAGPDRDETGHGPDRSATAAMSARPRPGTRAPDAPTRETPARGGVRPDRAPGAAARRR
jgi:tyrosine-protein kinase